MFLQELNEFDIMDFGEELNAYCVPEFNKDRTKVKIKLHFEDMNKTFEFILSDFNVKSIGFSASMFVGEVRRRWKMYMTKKFGKKYEDAYNKNFKIKNYNNKDLLDF